MSGVQWAEYISANRQLVSVTLCGLDKYGRPMVIIHADHGEASINEQLVAGGLALPYTGGAKDADVAGALAANEDKIVAELIECHTATPRLLATISVPIATNSTAGAPPPSLKCAPYSLLSFFFACVPNFVRSSGTSAPAFRNTLTSSPARALSCTVKKV